MSISTVGEAPGPTAPPTLAGAPGIGLVETKLRPPRNRPGLVMRTSLLDRLAESSAPIVSVVAPAGYGKTTLLGQSYDRCPVRSTWLSLDRYDNEPAVLLSHLVAALDRTERIDPKARRSLLADAAVDSSWSLRRLAGLVSSRRTPFLLVLDHVESVVNDRSGDLIASVAVNLPEGSRLALASRMEPPIPLPRMRASGLVEEIDRDDLAMDEQEAGELLLGTGVALTPAEVQELMVHTEGWPVGLYLAGLAIRSGASGVQLAEALHGDDRVVADYLRTEILSNLPRSTVTFLTRTSVLDQLSGPLCDAVTASTGSQDLLESLEESNLLLVPLDRQRRWYRCHHLMGEFLRGELEKTEPELVSRLHDRAATWFEANGKPDLALDHAQAAGDVDRAARVFGQIATVVHGSGRGDTILRWLSWFEAHEVIEQHPHVAVLGALMEALSGRRANSERLADAAATGDQESLAPDGSPLDSWIAVAEACLCRSGVDRMRSDAAWATRRLGVRSPLRGPATVLEGIAALLQGESTDADLLLAAGAELCLRNGNLPTASAALAERAVIAIDRGDTTAGRTLSNQALAFVSEGRLDGCVQSTVVYAVAARTAAQAGDVPAARLNVTAGARVRPLCTAAVPWSAQFLVQLARAYLALSDPAGARAVLRQVHGIMLSAPDLGVVPEQCDELNQMLETITVGSVGASSLTAAELRLLPLLATHLSYRDIGERLYVSRHTIKSQAVSVFRKLGVTSRSDAVQAAERIGLLGR